MISRVASSCFWLNRHAERTEALARFLAVNRAFVLDVDLPAADRWRPLVVVAGEEPNFLAEHGRDAFEDGEAVEAFLTWSEVNPTSLRNSVYWMRENARTIRETISLEMWTTVNALWLWINSATARKLYQRERDEFYLHVRDQCVLYQGHTLSTMLHEEPFDFMRLGTAVERVGQTARMLDVKYHSLGPTQGGVTEGPDEAAQWLAILRSCSAVEPFFKRRANEFSGPAVAGFLLLDGRFPRSVAHNLDRAYNFLERVRGPSRSGLGTQSTAELQALLLFVRELTIDRVLEQGIHNVLTRIVDDSATVCVKIHGDFFEPSIAVQKKAG